MDPRRTGRRRTPGDVLAGVGALAALTALLVGVPWALLAAFGSPVPTELPAAGDLGQRIGESALIPILVGLVWLAWLQFALCVAVEVYAGVRGVGVPARVPLAGGTQSLVHRLVVTALLLFTATTAVVPAFAARGLHQAPAAPAAVRLVAQVQDAPVEQHAERAAPDAAPYTAAAAPDEHGRTTKIYRVQPPEGRHHESLWEIAEKCLGEGRRYKEIYDLNHGRVQPDGSKLTIASLIRPGWVLEMPHDARHAKVVPVGELDDYFRHGHPVEHPAPREETPPAQTPHEQTPHEQTPHEQTPHEQTPPAQTPHEQTPREQAPPAQTPHEQTPREQAPPAQAPHEQTPHEQTPHEQAPPAQKPQEQAPPAQAPHEQTPHTQAPAPSEAPTHAPAQAPTHAPAHEKPEHAPAAPPVKDPGRQAPDETPASSPAANHDHTVPLPLHMEWPQGLAVASLLAAGLLAVLGRRRRAQARDRAFGHRIARPEGRAALAEHALRFGADESAARLLDLGLRQLSKSMAAGGRPLPTVYGVHLGPGSLDLWIAPADRNPPAPWQAFDDGQVWRLGADALPALDAADLGDVLAPYPGLVSIGTNDTGRILVDLEAAHGLVALRGPDGDRRAVLAALALELATNRWSDHMRVTLVGFGQELGEGLGRIAPDRIRSVPNLADALPELEGRSEEVRQALAASGVDSVLTGRSRGVFGEAWMPHYLIMADEPDEAEADRLVALARTGTRMAAGYLVPGDVQGATWTWDLDESERLQAGVLGFEVDAQLVPEEQYRGVFELFDTADRAESVALPEPSAGAEPPDGDQSAVDIRLLGPVEVDAPGPLDETRRELCTEALVYLALHPEGVHPTVLGGAIWPRGVTAGVRDATIARVSDWLGRDARGRPNLYYDDRGRVRLGSEVRVDWAVFRWLLWRSAAEPSSETAYMSYALDLVRGPLLADRPRGRYGWLAASDVEYEATARVVDVAHRLVLLRLDENDPRAAAGAARAGLRLAPEEEGLWRDLLRAVHALGDDAQVRAVVDELRDRLGRDPMYDGLQPETDALVEELVPEWGRVPVR
ncbi:BTAD domain-containing putative transcriptional regulator [Actinomadura atramentaria]|uniref:BTAD domain-containing putative transcriptional regulator n=1 Tax=Actinomadura atramentaria TaxID=1990 RepID=UPI00037B295D|nr:BTAD domain-containing putative transcriptional regulator [Actinomadura atramentaria]